MEKMYNLARAMWASCIVCVVFSGGYKWQHNYQQAHVVRSGQGTLPAVTLAILKASFTIYYNKAAI